HSGIVIAPIMADRQRAGLFKVRTRHPVRLKSVVLDIRMAQTNLAVGPSLVTPVRNLLYNARERHHRHERVRIIRCGPLRDGDASDGRRVAASADAARRTFELREWNRLAGR